MLHPVIDWLSFFYGSLAGALVLAIVCFVKQEIDLRRFERERELRRRVFEEDFERLYTKITRPGTLEEYE